MKIDQLQNQSPDTKIASHTFLQLGSFSGISDSVVDPPININAMTTVSRCVIGKYFNIGLYSHIADTKVGRYCTFASRCSIGAFTHPTNWLSVHEFQYRDTRNIWGESICPQGENKLQNGKVQTCIGNDVWIGDNSVIIRGVTIGDGAIIGASAVVTKDVPPYTIAVGNPAKPLRTRFHPHEIEQLLRLRWWDYDMEKLLNISFDNITKAIEQLTELKHHHA